MLCLIDTADGIAKDLLTAGLLEGRELVVGTNYLLMLWVILEIRTFQQRVK